MQVSTSLIRREQLEFWSRGHLVQEESDTMYDLRISTDHVAYSE